MAEGTIDIDLELGCLVIKSSISDPQQLYHCTIHRREARVPYVEWWPDDKDEDEHKPKKWIQDWEPVLADETTVAFGPALTPSNFTVLKRESTGKDQRAYLGLQLYKFIGDDPGKAVVPHFWEVAKCAKELQDDTTQTGVEEGTETPKARGP